MDADIAAGVVDAAFEAFGTPGSSYVPPQGGGDPVTDIVVIRHRRIADRSRGGFALGRGGLETTDRPQAVIVRSRDCRPLTGGIFVLPRDGGGETRFLVGEDPVEDDVWGYALRCAVVAL